MFRTSRPPRSDAVEPTRIYYWDFFGPRANGTAEHFVRHLGEFLAREGLLDCASGLDSQGRGHRAATCRVPQRHWAIVERALRPKRWRDDSPPGEA